MHPSERDRAEVEALGGATGTDLVGLEAGRLSLIEVGLGSLLHGLRIPLGGHFLSINQTYLLSRAVRRAKLAGVESREARRLPAAVSAVTAILKALSPAGARIGPMLAIAMQGTLFTAGTLGFGANPFGTAVGAALASTWAFVQPVLGYLALFGAAGLKLFEVVYERVNEYVRLSPESLWQFIAALIAFKAIVAGVVAAGSWYVSGAWLVRYEARLLRTARRVRRAPSNERVSAARAARGALDDIRSPLFVFSITLTFALLLVARVEHRYLAGALLRPLALGFLVFFVVRWWPWDGWLARSDARLARSLRRAIQSLREI